MDRRARGWLDEALHTALREALVHACVRGKCVCPVYCLMPDHGHFLILGAHSDADSRVWAKWFAQCGARFFLRASSSSARHMITSCARRIAKRTRSPPLRGTSLRIRCGPDWSKILKPGRFPAQSFPDIQRSTSGRRVSGMFSGPRIPTYFRQIPGRSRTRERLERASARLPVGPKTYVFGYAFSATTSITLVSLPPRFGRSGFHPSAHRWNRCLRRESQHQKLR